jgi:thermostable 8-oxoguanine DNA glycosylase
VNAAIDRICAQIKSASEYFEPFTDKDKDLFKLLERLKTAKERGFFLKGELYEIARLKSTRRAELTHRNDESDVKDMTALALKTDNNRIAVQLPMALLGVGVPISSAILAWVRPDRYGVIDRHAWASLERLGVFDQQRQAKVLFTVSDWSKYICTLRKISEHVNRHPQEVDFWLFRFNRDGGGES